MADGTCRCPRGSPLEWSRGGAAPRMTATRIIIGVTGATGTVYAVRLLELLASTDIETHLVMSRWAVRTLLHETRYTRDAVEALADKVYNVNDQGAAISSG